VDARRHRREERAIYPRPNDRARCSSLDAQHAGVLAFDRNISTCLKRFGNPKAEFGFADVWIVGPTVERCARIGD
jgi:hypothetical protein